MKTISIFSFSLLLVTLTPTNFAKAQIKYDKNHHGHSVIKVYTPPPPQITKEQLIESLNKNIKYLKEVYDGVDIASWKGLRALDDRFETQKGTLYYYDDFIIGDTIEIYESGISHGIYIPLDRNGGKNHLFASFWFSSFEYARDFAENMYYIFQSYRDNELALIRTDSIQFSSFAAKYRELTVKPAITEEQRKFIVRANSFAKDKLYLQAIEAFKKALAIDQVAYPVAYYNLALLLAEEKDFKKAIMNMKKYLLLVPDAPDARAAQDKIYEWER